ncbi:MAG: protein kinase domain-containing protein [Gemmatimonadaceae bacterium]
MTDPREQLQSALGSAYTLERELGGGGMSRTYLATELSLSRKVVVKVLAPELLAGISVDRFKREVLLAARLQHPHVVPVLTAGDAAGLPWFTMPYVEGESLRVRLARGPLRIGEIVGLLKDVARALEFAHSHGVVHRDIKPDNVLLAGSSATVTDFGIAKAITAARTDGSQRTALTVTGQVIGTPAYMAPEQAGGDPDVDQRSDIYSYGAMAYEMLAGRPPFIGATAKVIGAHFTETPRAITELRADTPSALAEVVMRCLEKDLARRPQTATELMRVLDSVVSSGAMDAAPAILLGGHIRLGRALSLWGTATALVTLTAWAATATIGIPDWVFPGSLGIMLAGLPVILATWYIQRTVRRAFTATPAYTPGGSESGHGTIASLAIKASPHFSWRRTWLGGAIAVAAFVALVIGFMVMRALGIGPVGSLMAAGKLDAGGTLVVADFRGPPRDTTLGVTVGEALRTDLGQSSAFKVMSRATVRDILRLMQRPIESAVHYDLAREIATREGAKAVIDGDIVKLGDSYVISSRLVATLDGTELATFRQEAADENSLITSLGKLSREIRGKVGESLKDIRDAQSLERVSTPSLPALRKYVEGIRYTDELGNTARGLALLEEAVAIDTAFAMGWRKIAAVVGNLRTDRPRQMAAATRAFRHRERLSENERLLTEAYYYQNGPEPNLDRAIEAYDAILEREPDHMTALNNSGVSFVQKKDWAKAEERYRAAIEIKRPFGLTFNNLILAQVRQGKIAAAESTHVAFQRRFPNHEDLWEGAWVTQWARSNLRAADSIARATQRVARSQRQGSRSAWSLAASAMLRGKIREALRWRAEGHQAIYRVTKGADRPLLSAIDSALGVALFYQDTARARGIVRRALAITPMAEIPTASRPWHELAIVAASMRDAQLAREALSGLEADLPQLGLLNNEAHRSFQRAWHAMSVARYEDAARAFQEASPGIVGFWEPLATVASADAFDLAAQGDSAIVHYEEFIAKPELYGESQSMFLAGTHKRLGELYVLKGDTAKAESHYAQFLELWKDADLELQPKVREVRERLAALRWRRG